MDEGQSLIVREETALSPRNMVDSAIEQAEVLADLIRAKKLSVMLQGREYVKVEGWVPLARMNGVIPREVSVEEMEDGRYIATVALVRLSDGLELTRASGECGSPDEVDRKGQPTWSSRPRYARRSMAITRATGKACRLAYSWIMSLAGYEPTPAEEMEPIAEAKSGTVTQREWDARGPHILDAQPAPAPAKPEKILGQAFAKITKIDPPKPTANKGQMWVFYADDGNRYQTFSDTVADLASQYVKEGIRVAIDYEEGRYGRKATGISEQTVFDREEA